MLPTSTRRNISNVATSAAVAPQGSPIDRDLVFVDKATRLEVVKLLRRSDVLPGPLREAMLLLIASILGRPCSVHWTDRDGEPLPDDGAVLPRKTPDDKGAAASAYTSDFGGALELHVRVDGSSYAYRDHATGGWVECGKGSIGLCAAVLQSLRSQDERAYSDLLTVFRGASSDGQVPASQLHAHLLARLDESGNSSVSTCLAAWQRRNDSNRRQLQILSTRQTTRRPNLSASDALRETTALIEATALDERTFRMVVDGLGHERSSPQGLAMLQLLAGALAGIEAPAERTICTVLKQLNHMESHPETDALLDVVARFLRCVRRPTMAVMETMTLKFMRPHSVDILLRAFAEQVERSPRLDERQISAVFSVLYFRTNSPGSKAMLHALVRHINNSPQFESWTIAQCLSELTKMQADEETDAVLQAMLRHIDGQLLINPQRIADHFYLVLKGMESMRDTPATEAILRVIHGHFRDDNHQMNFLLATDLLRAPAQMTSDTFEALRAIALQQLTNLPMEVLAAHARAEIRHAGHR